MKVQGHRPVGQQVSSYHEEEEGDREEGEEEDQEEEDQWLLRSMAGIKT